MKRREKSEKSLDGKGLFGYNMKGYGKIETPYRIKKEKIKNPKQEKYHEKNLSTQEKTAE